MATRDPKGRERETSTEKWSEATSIFNLHLHEIEEVDGGIMRGNCVNEFAIARELETVRQHAAV